jgi:hypothetical protein
MREDRARPIMIAAMVMIVLSFSWLSESSAIEYGGCREAREVLEWLLQ